MKDPLGLELSGADEVSLVQGLTEAGEVTRLREDLAARGAEP